MPQVLTKQKGVKEINIKCERHKKHYQSDWHNIGTFTLRSSGSDDYTGNIPSWVKGKIPNLLGKLGDNRSRWFKRKFGQKANAIIERMIVSSRFFEGTQFLKGRHYLYKISFKEGDERNYGEVFRKPVKSQLGTLRMVTIRRKDKIVQRKR